MGNGINKLETSTYTPLDFFNWHESGSLSLTPKFQRRSVWKRPARSYLIDSLLLGMPVPPIYLRVVQNTERTKMIREVIDGQQRISAILDFMRNKYSLSTNIVSPATGQTFSDLSDEQKDTVAQYPLQCVIFYGIADQDVLKIFARLNTNAVGLNAQELRNGKYFGPFKQSVYSLAITYLEFWRRNKIFTETGIARMKEVELTSELFIQQMDGIQDKKRLIDNYYEKFDETFDDRYLFEKRFHTVMDYIDKSCSSSLLQSEFRRPPLFYSLFGAVYHRLYGLPNQSLPTNTTGKMTHSEIERLSDQIIKLSEYITARKSRGRNDGDYIEIPRRFDVFVESCLRATDNVKPRQIRFETIYKEAFG